MKIKSIQQICKNAKRIELYSPAAANDQWISDGAAFYPLYNLPVLAYDSVCTMFDIPEKKRDKIYFAAKEQLPSNLNFEDRDPDELALEQGHISIAIGGRTLIPLKTSQGIVYIDRKYLAPFADAENGVQLYERNTPDGAVYVAVKEGFLCTGIIFPFDVINQEFVKDLELMWRLSAVALENKKIYYSEDELEQDEIDLNE